MSTKTVILRELQRGGDIVDRIFMKQLTWNDLFAWHSFFSQDYKYYLCITSSSKTKEAQSVWSGLVESRIRLLVGALDRKQTISVAHPFPKGFERLHTVKDDREADAVRNGSTLYQIKDPGVDSGDGIDDTIHTAAASNGADDSQISEPKANGDSDSRASDSRTIYTTTYYIGLEMRPLEPGRKVNTYFSSTNPSRCLEITGHIH